MIYSFHNYLPSNIISFRRKRFDFLLQLTFLHTSNTNQIYIPFTSLYTNFKYIEPWDFKQKLFPYQSSTLFRVVSYVSKLHVYNSSNISFLYIYIWHPIYTFHCAPKYILFNQPQGIKERSYYGGCHGSFVADDVFRF